MRNHTVSLAGAAFLLASAVAAAQQPAGPLDRDGAAAPGSGYGAPYSPRNAPADDETSGQALKFEDRWPAELPTQSAVPPPGPSPAGQPADKSNK